MLTPFSDIFNQLRGSALQVESVLFEQKLYGFVWLSWHNIKVSLAVRTDIMFKGFPKMLFTQKTIIQYAL